MWLLKLVLIFKFDNSYESHIQKETQKDHFGIVVFCFVFFACFSFFHNDTVLTSLVKKEEASNRIPVPNCPVKKMVFFFFF